MPNWKKVIVSGSNAILSNITASGDISASGDIHAANFIGSITNASTASLAESVEVTPISTNTYFPVSFIDDNNQFYKDGGPDGGLRYNPQANTLLTQNFQGLASSASFIDCQLLQTDSDFPLLFASHGVGGSGQTFIRTHQDFKNEFTYNPSSNTLGVDNIKLSKKVSLTGTSSQFIVSGANNVDFPVGGAGNLYFQTSSTFIFDLAARASNIYIGQTSGGNIVIGNGSSTTTINSVRVTDNVRFNGLTDTSQTKVLTYNSSTGYVYYTGSDSFTGTLQEVTELGASTTVPITASIISASGNLISSKAHIGTPTTFTANTSANTLVVGDGVDSSGITIYSQNNNNGSIFFADDLGAGNPVGNRAGVLHYNHTNDEFQLRTAGNQIAATIDNTDAAFEGNISASGTITANGATFTGNLVVTGSQLITDDITSDGTIRARVKSFDIPHPTRKNKRLVYGVIEGPEHGIYCRGESKELKVLLPPEWRAMVDKKGITVQITPIGDWQPLYFKKLQSNWLHFGCGDDRENVHFYWEVKGERTDVPKLQTVQ